MTNAPLTPRQSAILDYIRESIALRGHPPTVREIGAKFRIKSPNGVCCHIRALRKKGLVKPGGRRRLLELAGEATGAASIPMWRSRPSGPGLWVCEPGPGSPGVNTKDSMNALVLTAEDIERGAPFHTSRVYGPIPKG